MNLLHNITRSGSWSFPWPNLFTVSVKRNFVTRVYRCRLHASSTAAIWSRFLTCCFSCFNFLSFGNVDGRCLTGLRNVGNLLCGVIILFLVKCWCCFRIVFIWSSGRSGIGSFNSMISESTRGLFFSCKHCGYIDTRRRNDADYEQIHINNQ